MFIADYMNFFSIFNFCLSADFCVYVAQDRKGKMCLKTWFSHLFFNKHLQEITTFCDNYTVGETPEAYILSMMMTSHDIHQHCSLYLDPGRHLPIVLVQLQNQ